jgi:hypothetical protein
MPPPPLFPPCPNCGWQSAGSYCPVCGSPTRPERLTLRRIGANIARDGFNLERGFLGTMAALSIRPGQAIREYLSGRDQAYTNPLKYLLVWAALATLATVGLDILGRHLELMLPDPDSPESQAVMPFFDVMARWYNLVLLLGVPFLAAFSRLLFRGADFNLAEHLVFNGYVYGHQSAIFLAFVPIFLLAPGALLWVMGGYLLAIGAYYIWACVDFFRVGWLKGMFLANGVMVLAYLTYYAAIIAVVWGAGRFTG